jgi:hypothetical protein
MCVKPEDMYKENKIMMHDDRCGRYLKLRRDVGIPKLHKSQEIVA